MPAYADNFTSRYRVRYSSVGKTHTMQFRYATAGAPGATIRSGVTSFLNALAPLRFADWTVLGYEYSSVGTEFFLPLVDNQTVTAGAIAAQPGPTSWVPVNINFQALSSSAGRASWYVYGVGQNPLAAEVTADDYRLLASENPAVAAAVAALVANTALVANDNLPLVAVRNYANININSYYQRKARSG